MGKRESIKQTSDTFLILIYGTLFERFGPQSWWPAETPFEVIIGAILTQNTSWVNVASAIKNLKEIVCLEPKALYNLDIETLSNVIRPSGYYTVKAVRLKSFLEHLFKKYDGILDEMFNQGPDTLRNELLSIKGIGPETADSIILYAANKPVFVVDAYTRRIFSRHGLFPQDWPYEKIQGYFMDNLPKDTKIYNEYHALIVKLAKDFCRKKSQCSGCPLEKITEPFALKCL